MSIRPATVRTGVAMPSCRDSRSGGWFADSHFDAPSRDLSPRRSAFRAGIALERSSESRPVSPTAHSVPDTSTLPTSRTS